MPKDNRIGRHFYQQNTLEVSRQLLGKVLVRIDQGRRLAGMITECEAYRGEQDLGCHAKAGLTPRTQVMYGSAGHAYVYFTYGSHWMLNVVTEEQGFPAAVLLRSIAPLEGIEVIAARRAGRPRPQWTDGPGKLCQALGITKAENGLDMCEPDASLFIETGVEIPDKIVTIGPRVGLNSVPEPWKSVPWRFRVSPEDIKSVLSNFCPINWEE
jgi:DNA-3-methyladenine glycosylase